MSKEQKRDELTEIIIKASEEWLKLYGRQHLHLEHKAEHIAAAVNNAGYRKQSEWISVEERLPEDVYGGDRKIITVLVCTKSGRVSTASRVRMMRPNLVTMQYEYTDIFEWSGQIAKKVTHWMPLPEGPKGGEE